MLFGVTVYSDCMGSRIAILTMAIFYLAEARSTTVTFTCGQEFRFTVTWLGSKAQNVQLSTSGGETYRLRRTGEIDGRRFANETGNVILIIRDVRSANLTRGDTMVTGCSGTVPAPLLKTLNAGPH
jgi:hypothetical protein